MQLRFYLYYELKANFKIVSSRFVKCFSLLSDSVSLSLFSSVSNDEFLQTYLRL